MSYPAAFRSYYSDVGVTRQILETGKRWPPKVRWWAMWSRLKAVEVCGTQEVAMRFLDSCVEFRRPGCD